MPTPPTSKAACARAGSCWKPPAKCESAARPIESMSYRITIDARRGLKDAPSANRFDRFALAQCFGTLPANDQKNRTEIRSSGATRQQAGSPGWQAAGSRP
jgi:hypothetical protein